MSRNEFRKAYRAARLLKHTNYCIVESAKCDPKALEAAFRCRLAHVWRSGIESAKSVRKEGLSFSKCISIHLRAVKYRHVTGHFPATRFPATAGA